MQATQVIRGFVASCLCLSLAAATVGAEDKPGPRTYDNKLKRITAPKPLLADHPEFIEPVRENVRYEGPQLVNDMRRILVENARRKGRVKHGGGRRREQADVDAIHARGTAQELLALHEALEQFAKHDPLKARLVELRFFAGLTLEQAAECLNISLSTADRGWRYARAWLYAAMAGDAAQEKQL